MNKEKEKAKCNLLFLIFNYFKEFAQAYKLKHGKVLGVAALQEEEVLIH